MSAPLRPHQRRAIAAVKVAYTRERRVLMVAPTGFGKTHVSATLIAWAVAKGRKVLFLCPLREVVLDTYRRLVAAGVPCGVLMAGEPEAPMLPVQVASVATVAARGYYPPADFLIWDEAQHTAAETFRTIASMYEGAWHLGLTATPERGDGQGLRDAFDELVVGATVAELQATIDPETGCAYLAALDVVAPTRKQPSGVLADDPVDAWFAHARGRSTVAFCGTVDESRDLAAAFVARGVAARHLDGSTPAGERAAILRGLASGDITIVCNVMVLTEGFDCPRVKVILLARGCGSCATFLQMVGRGLRAWQGERALLIDLPGATHEHGMPEEERDYTLDGIRRRPAKKRPSMRQCTTCGFVVLSAESGRACTRCGTAWPTRPPATVKRVGLEVVVAADVADRELKRQDYAALLAQAKMQGYKPAWAGYRFRDRWGFWPRGLA